MAQGPDYKEEKNPFPFILSNDKPNRDPWAEGGISKPKDCTYLLYIGKDGRDYDTLEALQEANRRWSELFYTSKYPDKIVILNPFPQIYEKILGNR